MTPLTLISFGLAMFLLAASPGPGVFATVARALASGFSHAAVLVLGIVLGDLIFLLLAIYGLSAIADLLGNFFTLVKCVGGLYLIWLGIQIWRTPAAPDQVTGTVELSWKKNFSSGLIITLANPKVILFYLGFLPAFVELSALTTMDVLLIAAVVVVVLSSVLLSYAWAASQTGRFFKTQSSFRLLNRCAGGTMVTVGCAILLKE
ncbi:MAG: LysE family translocator [Thermodesulfobacteriota bacterium]